MVKRLITLGVALLLVASFLGMAMAVEGGGNARKGKYLFRKNCRTCHSDGGSAAALSPDTKTQAQWQRAFQPRNVQDYPCQDEFAQLAGADLNDVFTYLHDHAFDSPSPAKCK
jgi:mono/diheme cytochrome c family protein